ncbi:MAG: hypothetical protein RR454_00335 [Clostridia bacterium]
MNKKITDNNEVDNPIIAISILNEISKIITNLSNVELDYFTDVFNLDIDTVAEIKKNWLDFDDIISKLMNIRSLLFGNSFICWQNLLEIMQEENALKVVQDE